MALNEVDPRVVMVVDVKTPGSGEEARNRYQELQRLKPNDLVKFVICSREDYEWSRAKLDELQLAARCTVLFSPATSSCRRGCWRTGCWQIICRCDFQVQLHKYLWGNVAGK